MIRACVIASLEDHPNRGEIVEVLSQITQVGDADLATLARWWRNTRTVSTARGRALDPDSPLIIETLASLDAVTALYAEDLAGTAPYIALDPAVTTVALKAVRDAVVAAYGRPILGRAGYRALIAPWRAVFPRGRVGEPDLGPGGPGVQRLLETFAGLSARCHDAEPALQWDGLLASALVVDEEEHGRAVAVAWEAAVRTGRRRVWALVRRSAAEGLGRCCPSCRRRPDRDEERFLQLGMDAVCGLLVADAVDPATTRVLITAVAHLVPEPRGSLES